MLAKYAHNNQIHALQQPKTLPFVKTWKYQKDAKSHKPRKQVQQVLQAFRGALSTDCKNQDFNLNTYCVTDGDVFQSERLSTFKSKSKGAPIDQPPKKFVLKKCN